jgi:YHS domain-containing protein
MRRPEAVGWPDPFSHERASIRVRCVFQAKLVDVAKSTVEMKRRRDELAQSIETFAGHGNSGDCPHPWSTQRLGDDMSRHLNHDHDALAHADSARRDPVCGMTVAPSSPHVAEYSGRAYAFCSAGCRAKFIAEPTRYVDTQGNPRPASNTASDRKTHSLSAPPKASSAPIRIRRSKSA